MNNTDLFLRFGTALVIGMLIGLEREHAYDNTDVEPYAGIRTFALMGILGYVAALITDILTSPWPFIAILLVMGFLLAIAYFIAAQRDMGLTTEMSALVTILAGALCYWGYLILAAALGVVTAVLLSLKIEMHRFAHLVAQEDIYATLKFAVITAVILPILPDRSFAPPPFDVLNPYRIWLMVVFISGISFLGYLLMKALNPQNGIGLTGVLGGMVSSTAVTLSFSQGSRRNPMLAPAFAMAIVAAWTIMFVRVILEVAAINWMLLRILWLPMAAAAGVGIAYSGLLYFAQTTQSQEEIEFANPFELRPAIQFGMLYALILLVARTAALYLGDMGLYISSLVSGIADVDAITLTMAELSSAPDGLDIETASRAIVLAVMSNTCVKEGLVLFYGTPALRWKLLPGFVLMMLASVGIAFLV